MSTSNTLIHTYIKNIKSKLTQDETENLNSPPTHKGIIYFLKQAKKKNYKNLPTKKTPGPIVSLVNYNDHLRRKQKVTYSFRKQRREHPQTCFTRDV